MAGLLHDATRPPISLLFELVSLGADVGVGKLPGVELARMRGSATTGFSDPVARGYVTTAGSPARDAQIWAPMTGFACQPPPPLRIRLALAPLSPGSSASGPGARRHHLLLSYREPPVLPFPTSSIHLIVLACGAGLARMAARSGA